jgi:hypothetical protein
MSAGRATGYDAQTGPATDDEVAYLATRVDELAVGIVSARAVADGAKQTEQALRSELKQVSAELKAARAGRDE